MLKKISFLILGYVLMGCIAGCCDTYEEFDYRWQKLELLHLNNAGREPIFATTEIAKEAYGMRVKLHPRIVSQAVSFHPFNQAMALSCQQDVYNNPSYIETVTIYSVNQFSESIEAEADVTSLFKARRTGDNSEFYESVNELVASWGGSSQDLLRSFDIYLMEPPTAGTHQFRVDIKLSNGRHLIDTSAPIELITL